MEKKKKETLEFYDFSLGFSALSEIFVLVVCLHFTQTNDKRFIDRALVSYYDLHVLTHMQKNNIGDQ